MRIVKNQVLSLKNFFSKQALSKLAAEAEFIRRKRKLTVMPFLKSVLILSSRSYGSSLESLAGKLYDEGIEISRQSLHAKIGGTAVKFMKRVFHELSRSFMENNQIGCFTTNFTDIKIADSSESRLNRNLQAIFQGTQNGPGYKLQALYSLLRSHIECEVTELNRNDQGYKTYLDHIEEGDLVIFDLGYSCIKSFNAIKSKPSYFVSRLPRGITISCIDHGPIALGKLLTETKTDIIDRLVTIGKKDKLDCRLIGCKLTGKGLEQRIEKTKRDSRRSGKSITKELVEADYWSIYITNLDNTYPIKEVHNLYSLRWQIELLFKVMKSKLSMDTIKDINPCKVQLIIYGKLILLLLALILLRSFQKTEISLYKAIDYYKEQFEVILDEIIKGKWRKLKLYLLKIERFAKKSSRKNRLSSKQRSGFCAFFSSA